MYILITKVCFYDGKNSKMGEQSRYKTTKIYFGFG